MTRHVLFTPEFLVSICRGTYRVVENPIPRDAKIESVAITDDGDIVIEFDREVGGMPVITVVADA